MKENINRKFGESNAYYPTHIRVGKRLVPALFTYTAVKNAIDRAAAQPEDAPKKNVFKLFLLRHIS